MGQKDPGGQNEKQRLYSRRTFLKGFPIGIAGAFVFSLVASRLLSSRRRRELPSLPEGSIFTPDKTRLNRS